MKNKVLAIFLLSVILIIIIGMAIYFIQSTKLDVVENANLKGTTISLLLSINYEEVRNEHTKSRVISLLLLLNPKTKNLGILELPAYTGVYSKEKDQIAPIDSSFTQKGYKAYFNMVKNTLGIPNLQYIYVSNEDIIPFIDVLGGVKIFLLNEEFNISDANVSNFETGIGNINFDGPGVKKYISDMEDTGSEELLKSTKRKELITAILRQIKSEQARYIKSKKIISHYNKYIKTSLDKNGLKNILQTIANYNLENLYFQRLNGILRTVNISNESTNDNSEDYILFTSNEVGNFAKIVAFLQNNLSQEYSERQQDKITISILNGTLLNGLARKTKLLYEEAGFQVLSIGNASSTNVETTTIIDRIGNTVNANNAAEIIGARSIITDITSVDQAGADITLIIGKDYTGAKTNE